MDYSMDGYSRIPQSEEEDHTSRVVRYLDKIVRENGVHRRIPLAGDCWQCGSRRYGEFDEAHLQFVPGTLERLWHLPLQDRIIVGFGTGSVRHTPIYTNRYISPYAVKQLIVKSGIYHRDQLRGCRFNEHELELAEKSYFSTRPFQCGCNEPWTGYEVDDPSSLPRGFSERSPGGGSSEPFIPSTELMEFINSDIDVTTSVGGTILTKEETEFISGKPVRTGFRRRSAAARIRRHRRRIERKVVICDPTPDYRAVGTGLAAVNPAPIRLVFKFKPSLIWRCTYRKKPVRGPKWDIEHLSKMDKQFSPDRRMSPKDWYFLRNRGMFYHSIHNCGYLPERLVESLPD